jgi:hypothetical protein
VSAVEWNAGETRVSVAHRINDKDSPFLSSPLHQIVEDIRTNGQQPVKRIREIYEQTLAATRGDHAAAKEAIREEKVKQLRVVRFCGTFADLKDASLREYSSLVCADVDNLDQSKIDSLIGNFRKDQHVAVLFRSPSGYGLKIVFRVSRGSEHHGQNFEDVRRWCLEAHDLEIDASGKNVGRWCFLSHDPQIVFREHPKPLPQHHPCDAGDAVHTDTQTTDSSESLHLLRHKCVAALSNNRSRIDALKALGSKPILAKLYEEVLEPRFTALSGQRNKVITEAVPFLFRAVAPQFIPLLMGTFYDCNRALFKTDRDQHITEVNRMIKYIAETYSNELSPEERAIHEELAEPERSTFRVCRDLAIHPQKGYEVGTFFMAYNQLGGRIGIHTQQAKRSMQKLAGIGLVELIENGAKRERGKKPKACVWRWLLL